MLEESNSAFDSVFSNPDQLKGVILGTAGHIDHGKSSIVKALTGTDPDRLKEEKERGITIDLGFANLYCPDKNLVVGIVDVPGHERLIKNMLAGAGGIDILLMVIAADEGIMPQSREHLAICDLLNIKKGIVAITKADLVDKDWLKLVKEDVINFVKGSFLEGADILEVSAKTGFNIELLKSKICELAAGVNPKPVRGLFRMPIDRVFTQKGFGTVVTGTALSGAINVEDTVEILPYRIKTRVRGLQTHGRSVRQARAGQRIGINLQGVDRESLKRGDVVAAPDRFIPTKAVDARLYLIEGAPPLKSRSLVHFYCGTSEIIARVILYGVEELSPGDSCFCQFRLEDLTLALSGDRYIIRRFSPLETLGGGEILDPHPVRRKRKAGVQDLELFEKGALASKIEELVRRSGLNGRSSLQIQGWFNEEIPDIESNIDKLVGKGILIRRNGRLYHREIADAVVASVKERLEKYHASNPLRPGMPREALKAYILGSDGDSAIFDLACEMAGVVFDKDLVRLKSFNVSLSAPYAETRDRIINTLEKAAFQPPLKSELALEMRISEKEADDMLRLLAGEGALVRINDSMYITRSNYDKMIDRLRDFFSVKNEMGVSEFRDMLQTSRKYSIPLLEYLDSHKITLRIGDVRKFMLK